MKDCKHCGKTVKRGVAIYCSNQCQADYQYSEYVKQWKQGIKNGERGIETKGLSKHLYRFLIDKYGNRCSLCGWEKINPITGKVPVEIDHIDGDSKNNKENNLQLICPNCHSLTPSFRNLNRGNGRSWRRNKYIKE
ncbi:MAG: HNH endonuclease signature motif containing protein [Candidatus Saccharibacteria bacterium]|nr:HNH endonuclease signature motif containing protein [Candidatus Saccharibacteria bacterium]